MLPVTRWSAGSICFLFVKFALNTEILTLPAAGRTDVIVSYTYGKRLKNWLAIDDFAYGAAKFGREPGELTQHFLLLDSARGIGDESTQQRIRQWLIEVHSVERI